MTTTTTTTDSARIARCRRAAAHHGMAVHQVPQQHRDFPAYGPFVLLDASTRSVHASGLELEDLEQALR